MTLSSLTDSLFWLEPMRQVVAVRLMPDILTDFNRKNLFSPQEKGIFVCFSVSPFVSLWPLVASPFLFFFFFVSLLLFLFFPCFMFFMSVSGSWFLFLFCLFFVSRCFFFVVLFCFESEYLMCFCLHVVFKLLSFVVLVFLFWRPIKKKHLSKFGYAKKNKHEKCRKKGHFYKSG